MHLIMRANSLNAEVELAAGASIVRLDADGEYLQDDQVSHHTCALVMTRVCLVMLEWLILKSPDASCNPSESQIQVDLSPPDIYRLASVSKETAVCMYVCAFIHWASTSVSRDHSVCQQ